MSSNRWRGQLSHIGLRVADVPHSAEFYRSVVGMSDHGGDGDAHVRLGWGTGAHAMDLLSGPAGLDHFALEIPDPAELESVVSAVAASGVSVEHVPADAGQPETHRMLDPEHRVVELHGRVDRSGETGGAMGRRPVRLQHITFATRAMDDMIDFYAGVMGLRISDRMGSIFTWLRCGVEHHTIAMVNSAEGDLDHFSFDLGGWADFRDWADHLSQHRVPLTWGPGRHGPGNNLFLMFDDPDGNRIELSAEMESYFDELASYPARTWKPEQHTVNLWGPAPVWRVPQPAEDHAESVAGTA
jgi:catechol 2,3-dioxygenase